MPMTGAAGAGEGIATAAPCRDASKTPRLCGLAVLIGAGSWADPTTRCPDPGSRPGRTTFHVGATCGRPTGGRPADARPNSASRLMCGRPQVAPTGGVGWRIYPPRSRAWDLHTRPVDPLHENASIVRRSKAIWDWSGGDRRSAQRAVPHCRPNGRSPHCRPIVGGRPIVAPTVGCPIVGPTGGRIVAPLWVVAPLWSVAPLSLLQAVAPLWSVAPLSAQRWVAPLSPLWAVVRQSPL